eukprot:scaffold334205_cov70-Cyclotella_meneghiniana.AAC.1
MLKIDFNITTTHTHLNFITSYPSSYYLSSLLVRIASEFNNHLGHSQRGISHVSRGGAVAVATAIENDARVCHSFKLQAELVSNDCAVSSLFASRILRTDWRNDST